MIRDAPVSARERPMYDMHPGNDVKTRGSASHNPGKDEKKTIV